MYIRVGPIVDIIDNELKNRGKEDARGRRYSDGIKRLALTIHYASRTAYDILRFFLQDKSLSTYFTLLLFHSATCGVEFKAIGKFYTVRNC